MSDAKLNPWKKIIWASKQVAGANVKVATAGF